LMKRTKVLQALNSHVIDPPPIWLMRQAGRYLPEYKQVRAQSGSFWTMCMTPDIAVEVTLQPIRRFGFDAAIIFSDILVVPFALGRRVVFEERVGPKLERVTSVDELVTDESTWAERLGPIYEAVGAVRRELAPETELLGFAGAPWTLASYLAEGGMSSDQRAAKLWGYQHPEEFLQLLYVLERCVAEHLIAQLRAGAGAVQLFDSWASGLPEREFSDWVVSPNRRVVERVRSAVPDAKIIGFPRCATQRGYERFVKETGVNAISVDTAVALDWAFERFEVNLTLQGNLDPVVLVAGGAALDKAMDNILLAATGRPFIFNLGHGILPETPLENVAYLVDRVRRPR
jgi:uroporphyrinogen decarboxylase